MLYFILDLVLVEGNTCASNLFCVVRNLINYVLLYYLPLTTIKVTNLDHLVNLNTYFIKLK